MTVPSRPSPRGLSGLQRLAVAFGHPLRVELLRLFATGIFSATSAAKALRQPRANVHYHVIVLARECDILELAFTKTIGSATERFYQLRSRHDLASLDASDLPSAIHAAVQGSAGAGFVDQLSEALTLGATDHDGTRLMASPILLDARGWEGASTAIRATVDQFDTIEAEARARIGHDRGAAIHAMTGLALFRVPAVKKA
jgi:hypothetical protein